MADVDNWLADAAKTTTDVGHEIDSNQIMRRLTVEAGPALSLARQDTRLVMLCAAMAAAAAMLLIAGSEKFGWKASGERPEALWLSTPPAASPFGLLVGA